jgi:GNAT superfamily N-acetyltransferase
VTQSVSIRRAAGKDASAISAIWEAIVAERDHSAVDRAFPPEEEQAYIESLSPREGIFVAEVGGRAVGFQSLDLWVRHTSSMDHVGQLGTFVLKEWRGRGIGRRLAEHTLAFARENRYEKLVIWVMGKNAGAQRFYKGIRFVETGRLSRQVRIAGEYDDEILMERFL